MEKTFRPHSGAPLGLFAALRDRSHRIRAFRQNRRGMAQLNQLPDHLLRDIGREDLIGVRIGAGSLTF